MARVSEMRAVKDKSVISMFNQMIGTENPDLNVIIPKYNEITGLLEEVRKGLARILDSPAGSILIARYPDAMVSYRKFVAELQSEIEKYRLVEQPRNFISPAKRAELNNDIRKLTAYQLSIESCYKCDDIQARFTALKNCQCIIRLIKTYRNLLSLIKEETENGSPDPFESPDKVTAGFIVNAIGDGVYILDFARIDFKHTLIQKFLDPESTNFLLRMMRYLFLKFRRLHELLTSPDIDPKMFGAAIIGMIDRFRTELPGCDDAFDHIADSIGMFETNFSGYYKGFVESNSPQIIIESFVSDIASEFSNDKPNSNPNARRRRHKNILMKSQFNKILGVLASRMKSDGGDINTVLQHARNNLSKLAGDPDAELPGAKEIQDLGKVFDTVSEGAHEAISNSFNDKGSPDLTEQEPPKSRVSKNKAKKTNRPLPASAAAAPNDEFVDAEEIKK